MRKSWIKRSQKPMRRSALNRGFIQLKRTPLSRGTYQLKRTPLNRGTVELKRTPLKTKTKLKAKGSSEASVIKERIQDTLRLIVMLRDGGCVLRDEPRVPECNGYRKDGELILQADHLITRANSATYADSRLVVCVCKGHHGWKKWNAKQYDAAVEKILPPERVLLWQKCEQERWKAQRTGLYDWKLYLIALEKELVALGGTPLPSLDVS